MPKKKEEVKLMSISTVPNMIIVMLNKERLNEQTTNDGEKENTC